ncbi:MAG: hypothetical protein ACJ76S_03245 [Solirubrobacteraceae bacterium]
MANWNALQWDGEAGHYEVYYLTLTDRPSGIGLWIRYTMLAPLRGEPSCSLWLAAMDPGPSAVLGLKSSYPAGELVAQAEPFELRVQDATLTDRGMSGRLDGASWDLRWEPRLPAAEHVHPLLRRAKLAKTVLVLPHPDVEVSGTVRFDGRELALEGARGAQAHLWGSKHAARWAWAHCNDFESMEGEPRRDCYLDGVSVFVPRLGRELGPSTPVVGRFHGRDFHSTGPLRVARNHSVFGLTSWHLKAADGDRRVTATVDADRHAMVGVTYHDPDGERAYCYNTETASMQVRVWEGDHLVDELTAPGRAHFEYAQREPVPGVELQVD